MSKLIDSMKEVCLNERKVVQAPVDFDVEERVEEIRTPYETATRYSFRIQLGVDGFARDGEEVSNLRTIARRHIAEFAFGEFKAHIMQIEGAILEHDSKEALRLLRSMEAEMFNVN